MLGNSEPDEEVQDLLRASAGRNLAMDFLPGALGFDPLAHTVDPDLASGVLWFDALIGNVDRSWKNPNLLLWHRQLQLIDHGASLVFHHSWARAAGAAAKPYDASDHVLAAQATRRAEADARLAPLVTPALLEEVTALVPDAWLEDEPGFDTAGGRPGGVRRPPAAPGRRARRVGTVTRAAYDYALLRAVPRVERGECLNVGVVLFCKERDLLEARRAPGRGPAAGARPRRRRRGRPARRWRPCAGPAAGTGRPARPRSASGSAGSPPRAAPCCRPGRCTAAPPTTRPPSCSGS